MVWCQLRPEEIGHDERRADREEVRWREPCERVTHALPDLPAWPVRIGSGRRGQQSERPGGEHPEGSATRAPGNFEGAASGCVFFLRKYFINEPQLPYDGVNCLTRSADCPRHSPNFSPLALPPLAFRPLWSSRRSVRSPLPSSASVRLRVLLHVEYLGEAVLPLPPGVGLCGEGGHEGAHTWLGLGLGLELGLGLGLA